MNPVCVVAYLEVGIAGPLIGHFAVKVFQDNLEDEKLKHRRLVRQLHLSEKTAKEHILAVYADLEDCISRVCRFNGNLSLILHGCITLADAMFVFLSTGSPNSTSRLHRHHSYIG